jgi:DNA (cytosine-5)-methyltransferase 1
VKKRPLLLDLFCGAGGCAVGYHRAGFDVVGVDLHPQPRYPFEFHQADALEFLAKHGHEFDAIHASPPCQLYSAANNIHGRKDHPDLIGPTREALVSVGRPWVIENVPRAPLLSPATVCGLALGLGVRRHRLFEASFLLFGTQCGDHRQDYAIVFGGGVRGRAKQIGRTVKGGPIIRRPTLSLARGKASMGIEWMTCDELSQAIPPAYTHYVGRQLLTRVRPNDAGYGCGYGDGGTTLEMY